MTTNGFWPMVVASFFGALGFAVLFNTKGRRILIPAAGGAVFWAFYLLFHAYVSGNVYLGFFTAAVLLTIYSEIWAKVLKTPVTTVLIPTVIPFIPGGDLYYTVLFALKGDSVNFAVKARSALGSSVALAAGIMVVTVILNQFKINALRQRKNAVRP